MPDDGQKVIFQVVGEASAEVTKADGTPRSDDNDKDGT